MIGRSKRRRAAPWVVAAACGLGGTAAGCEPALTPGAFEAQEIDAGGGEVGGDAGQGSVDFTDMTGTWALAVDLSSCATLFGLTQETRNQVISKVEIVQEGLLLREVHEDCVSANTPVAGLAAVVPLSTVQTANPMQVESTLFGTNVGNSYRSRVKARVWGIRLDDPRTDFFPRAGDLPDDRIFDADEDGNPGVTLDIGNGSCQIFIIQRALESAAGKLMPDGSVEGEGSLLTVQTVLGATNNLCSTPYDVEPNDDFSNFRMVRVDGAGLDFDDDGDGDVSCGEILAHQRQILEFKEADHGRCAADGE